MLSIRVCIFILLLLSLSSTASSLLTNHNLFIKCGYHFITPFHYHGSPLSTSRKPSYHCNVNQQLYSRHKSTLFLDDTTYYYDYTQLHPITDTSSSSSSSTDEDASSAVPPVHHKQDNDNFHFPSDDDLLLLPNGKKGGFKVLYQYTISKDLWSDEHIGYNDDKRRIKEDDKRRNSNNDDNCYEMTIQEALFRLDPHQYKSLSKARKACRNGSILIHRGPIVRNNNETTIPGASEGKTSQLPTMSYSTSCKDSSRARVGDIVYLNDVIGVQQFMGTYRKKRCYPLITYSRPKFALPVLYEDDYIAIVDKPAGIGMYGKRKTKNNGSSNSRRTIRDALPYVLTPPKKGVVGQALRRPMAVHRLDTPTNGLVVVAKTKEAMQHLSKQFECRKVQKTYTAIVNGIPIMYPQQCYFDDKKQLIVDENGESEQPHQNDWNVVNYPLSNKHAITHWKTLRSVPSLHAKDGILTLIVIRPLTGRYHQIRRHMAWICRRPLVGDHIYAGLLQAPRFYRNGLYLCSNGIILEHPYYNTPKGMVDWVQLNESYDRQGDDNYDGVQKEKTTDVLDSNASYVYMDKNDNLVKIQLDKQLPKRFAKLLNGEEAWALMKQSKTKRH